MTREYIDLLTAGGTITIDLTGSLESGLIDASDDATGDMETTGDLLLLVVAHMAKDMHLIDATGHPVIVAPQHIIARTYRRSES